MTAIRSQGLFAAAEAYPESGEKQEVRPGPAPDLGQEQSPAASKQDGQGKKSAPGNQPGSAGGKAP